MNERIKELIVQTRRILATDALSGGEFNMRAYEEKFAELLAQDVISVVQSFRWKMDASNDNIVVALKQHFGVE